MNYLVALILLMILLMSTYVMGFMNLLETMETAPIIQPITNNSPNADIRPQGINVDLQQENGTNFTTSPGGDPVNMFLGNNSRYISWHTLFSDLNFADLDGDTDLEVYVLNEYMLYRIINDTYREPLLYYNGTHGVFQSMEIITENGDDYIFISTNTGWIHVYSSNFTLVNEIELLGVPELSGTVVIASNEYVFYTSTGDNFMYILNSSGIVIYLDLSSPQGVFSGNKDGSATWFFVPNSNFLVNVSENGLILSQTQLTGMSSIVDVKTGDFDDDGDEDIAVKDDNGEIRIYTSSYALLHTYSSTSPSNVMESLDLDTGSTGDELIVGDSTGALYVVKVGSETLLRTNDGNNVRLLSSGSYKSKNVLLAVHESSVEIWENTTQDKQYEIIPMSATFFAGSATPYTIEGANVVLDLSQDLIFLLDETGFSAEYVGVETTTPVITNIDIDGDGNDDFIYPGESGLVVVDTNGSLIYTGLVGDKGFTINFIAFANLDDAGYLDVVAANSSTMWAKKLPTNELIFTKSITGSMTSLYAGDLSSNPNDEIIAHFSNDSLSYYRNDGTKEKTITNLASTFGTADQMYVGDFSDAAGNELLYVSDNVLIILDDTLSIIKQVVFDSNIVNVEQLEWEYKGYSNLTVVAAGRYIYFYDDNWNEIEKIDVVFDVNDYKIVKLESTTEQPTNTSLQQTTDSGLFLVYTTTGRSGIVDLDSLIETTYIMVAYSSVFVDNLDGRGRPEIVFYKSSNNYIYTFDLDLLYTLLSSGVASVMRIGGFLNESYPATTILFAPLATLSYLNFGFDYQLPSITILTPSIDNNVGYVNQTNGKISWIIEDDLGVRYVLVKSSVGGKPYQMTTGNEVNYTFDDGETITIQVVDFGYNIIYYEFDVVLDVVAPTISPLEDYNMSIFTTDRDLYFTISDDKSDIAAFASLNGGQPFILLESKSFTSVYVIPVKLGQLHVGNNSLVLTAIDLAGNKNIYTIYLLVEETNPFILFWNAFWPFIVGGLVLIVIGVGGFFLYKKFKTSR